MVHIKLWCCQLDLCFYAQWKGADQGWEGRGFPLVRLGTASRGRLTGKLSPGCLADTGWTSLTNEGLHPVHWDELSTFWPDGNVINFKLLVILIRNLRGIKDQDLKEFHTTLLWSISQTPGVSVCWHCSIMFLFMMWTSSSHLSLNSWWPRVGEVGCPPPHCSSHLTFNSWWPRVGRVGWGVILLISLTKLIAAQQWNQTDFHHCMPAQLKLVLA